MSWATACVEHKLRLLDRCSHCASILAPFRARGFACFNCGAALADGQRLPASEMVLSLQMRQELILAQGWGELGPSHFPYSVQYFQTIRHVARSLSLGARATTFRTVAAESWGGDPSPYEGEKRDIDVLTATERHRLFDLVSRLLEEWPERFVSTASTAGLWQSWALRDDDRPPFGGMAGCAMIGQSIINVTSGGRGRLSTLWAGLFLLFLILVLRDWVAQIPMAALVAVMIMVSIGTFDWGSILKLRSTPFQSSLVMIATTVTVVATHDLSKGVILGVLLSAIFFMRKVGKTVAVTEIETPEEGVLRYRVTGQLFFASPVSSTCGSRKRAAPPISRSPDGIGP